MEGDPKFVASQQIPNVPYYRFATLLGLKGIYVDDPEQLGAAWDEALAADRPVVLEVKSDPSAAAAAARDAAAGEAFRRDARERRSARGQRDRRDRPAGAVRGAAGQRHSGRQARQRRIVRRKRDGPMRHGALADVDVVPVAVQHKRRGPACASVNGILRPCARVDRRVDRRPHTVSRITTGCNAHDVHTTRGRHAGSPAAHGNCSGGGCRRLMSSPFAGAVLPVRRHRQRAASRASPDSRALPRRPPPARPANRCRSPTSRTRPGRPRSPCSCSAGRCSRCARR